VSQKIVIKLKLEIFFLFSIFVSAHPFSHILQKEEKIRLLKQRLAERDQQKGDLQSSSQLQLSQQANINNGTMNTSNQLGLNQGKDGLQIIIQAEQTTTSDFDSAFGNGFSISACTRSSEVEFSESYL
jgi:hypothetical protein